MSTQQARTLLPHEPVALGLAPLHGVLEIHIANSPLFAAQTSR